MYYIVNFLIIGVYPVTRMLSMFNFYFLDRIDELGTTRENSIFYTIIAFIVVKWFRRTTTKQYLSSIFFTIKLSLVCSYFFVDVRVSMGYAVACLAVWLLFSEPKYNGPTMMTKMESLEQFENVVGVHFKDAENGDIIEEVHEKYTKRSQARNNNKKNKAAPALNYKQADMVFAEFYVDWADTCTYTKEIWAEYSMKYTTNQLRFISVDLAQIPRLAECYRINTSGVSRQLPTLILFEDGEEHSRFPPIDNKTNRIARVLKYGKKEIGTFFDLDKRYLATRDL